MSKCDAYYSNGDSVKEKSEQAIDTDKAIPEEWLEKIIENFKNNGNEFGADTVQTILDVWRGKLQHPEMTPKKNQKE